MAKNKKKSKGQQQAKISPERFMREKARKLPMGKCYITPRWQEAGIAQIIISRVRPDGSLVVGIFLVDTFCIGVKDATYNPKMSEYEFQELLDRCASGPGLEEISYPEAHNIIYGAIGFAEDGGIKPAKDFKIAGYILEEDTDYIPLIEYEFGKNGKHFLVINSDRREMPYLHQLKKTLGDDFKFVMNYDGDDEFFDQDDDDEDVFTDLSAEDFQRAMEKWEKSIEESRRHPIEEYSYHYTEYPESPSVKNQFIADELLSKNNCHDMPKSVIERILALPHDEAAEDISKIVMYEIGRTYQSINDNTIEVYENAAIMHALYLLTQLRSEKGLDAVLEIMRQNGEFADYHLGDFAPDVIPPALYACGMNNIPAIEAYLNQPGLDSYLRGRAFDALTMIVFLHPERREEIIEVLRKILQSWVGRLPKQEACDGSLAGSLMSNLMDLGAKELIAEIKAVFETDCVDKTVAGGLQDVLDEIQNGRRFKNREKYKFPDIYQQYDQLRSCAPSNDA